MCDATTQVFPHKVPGDDTNPSHVVIVDMLRRTQQIPIPPGLTPQHSVIQRIRQKGFYEKPENEKKPWLEGAIEFFVAGEVDNATRKRQNQERVWTYQMYEWYLGRSNQALRLRRCKRGKSSKGKPQDNPSPTDVTVQGQTTQQKKAKGMKKTAKKTATRAGNTTSSRAKSPKTAAERAPKKGKEKEKAINPLPSSPGSAASQPSETSAPQQSTSRPYKSSSTQQSTEHHDLSPYSASIEWQSQTRQAARDLSNYKTSYSTWREKNPQPEKMRLPYIMNKPDSTTTASADLYDTCHAGPSTTTNHRNLVECPALTIAAELQVEDPLRRAIAQGRTFGAFRVFEPNMDLDVDGDVDMITDTETDIDENTEYGVWNAETVRAARILFSAAQGC